MLERRVRAGRSGASVHERYPIGTGAVEGVVGVQLDEVRVAASRVDDELQRILIEGLTGVRSGDCDRVRRRRDVEVAELALHESLGVADAFDKMTGQVHQPREHDDVRAIGSRQVLQDRPEHVQVIRCRVLRLIDENHQAATALG